MIMTKVNKAQNLHRTSTSHTNAYLLRVPDLSDFFLDIYRAKFRLIYPYAHADEFFLFCSDTRFRLIRPR